MRANWKNTWNKLKRIASYLILCIICWNLPLTPARADVFGIAPGDVDALIQAIETANINREPDIIYLSAGTYHLSESVANANGENGLPSITSVISIIGAGPHSTTIERVLDSPDFRIFHVAERGRLVLNALSVKGGVSTNFWGGGGIYNAGRLTLNNTTVAENAADSDGGGIFNMGQNMTIQDSTIRDNTALGSGGEGGGIYNTRQGFITRSTISGNVANISGGGIMHEFSHLLLNNTTISGNTAGSGGGALDNDFGDVFIANSTITENSPHNISNTFWIEFTVDGSLLVRNSIIANSDAGSNCKASPRFFFIYSLGHNLDDDGSCQFNAVGDISFVNPQLGALADNGGPTQTHALLPGSPAIDAGSFFGCPPLDQRGESRPEDGNGDRIPICDIGAFEFKPLF